jgi:formylglycine-generating enzyme required for sulfatase activity
MRAATRAPQRGHIHRDTPDAPEIVLIGPGTFTMGIPIDESQRMRSIALDRDTRPTHAVAIARPFWLGRFPVTRDEYAAFVQATGYTGDDGTWRNPGFPQSGRDPVVRVAAADVTAYIAWLTETTGKRYRLPSEAEWEYAARAGTTASRFWGDTFIDADHHAWFDEIGRWTAPVDERKPNPFGLHDMLGNVWEWTADSWHATYHGAPTDGSARLSTDTANWRVLRGGAWYGNPKLVRAGVRYRVDAAYRDADTGFRGARDIDETDIALAR